MASIEQAFDDDACIGDRVGLAARWSRTIAFPDRENLASDGAEQFPAGDALANWDRNYLMYWMI
jgi:hypothetical protein